MAEAMFANSSRSHAAVSGKKITFFSMPDNMFMEVMKPVVGERMADGFLTMWRGIRETGCESARQRPSPYTIAYDTRLCCRLWTREP